MKSADIRQSFIDFFAEQGHRHLPSAPLVPHGDATLLFTNAGMVQFKDWFLGASEAEVPRAVTAQKCMRVSGKHNDLENVGPSPRHHTFFEMLGNFSFGDYFKDEAIELAWRLVTETWELPPARLFATVFRDDDEAADLWKRISDLPAERIVRCGAKDNFWAMGDTGPCGPCSEIFVDMAPDQPHVDWEEGSESGRYLEIWNLVFMQFDRDASGETAPLPAPSIDTGAGLERLAAVLQGVDSNYDSDLFRPILAAAATLAGKGYGDDPDDDVSMRVLADHVRAVAFLLADGVIPANEGRGYVLRRVLRRAARHGMRLGFDEPFLHRLVPIVGEVLGEAYPELGATEKASVATVEAEERKFLATLAAGSRQVQEAIDAARREDGDRLEGDAVFRLYDTYGIPIEVLREIAEEERMTLDEEGFEAALAEQRHRSRAAGGEDADLLQGAGRALGGEGTPFVGYDRLAGETTVLGIFDGERAVDVVAEGAEAVLTLGETPFYAEAGGQVGDRGALRWTGGEAEVLDTRKDRSGTHYHFVRVIAGELATGADVEAVVDAERRHATERNHTATHLLHAALRHELGDGVRQAGSLVAPDRLRFDFTHPEPVGDEELETIARLVNRWILEARETVVTDERDFEEAVDAGAMALFGEKYGDRVRTVEVPGGVGSLELCGGCHVRNVGEIGPFRIVSERGTASGVRRIEALTGEGALRAFEEETHLLRRVADELGVPPERVAEEAVAEKRRIKELEGELSRLRMELVSGAEREDEETLEVEGIRVAVRQVPPAPAGELRSMADVLRSRLESGVVVLAASGEGKVTLIAAVTDDLVDRLSAGRLVKELAGRVGGGGGGRADFAQAGGREPEKLPQALADIPEIVREQLAAQAI